MIQAVFSRTRQRHLAKVEVAGHADYAAYGSDIVCASVTSAVQMAANGITEVLGSPAQVVAEDNRIVIALPHPEDAAAQAFLQALLLHLELLMEQYSDYVNVTVLEV